MTCLGGDLAIANLSAVLLFLLVFTRGKGVSLKNDLPTRKSNISID